MASPFKLEALFAASQEEWHSLSIPMKFQSSRNGWNRWSTSLLNNTRETLKGKQQEKVEIIQNVSKLKRENAYDKSTIASRKERIKELNSLVNDTISKIAICTKDIISAWGDWEKSRAMVDEAMKFSFLDDLALAALKEKLKKRNVEIDKLRRVKEAVDKKRVIQQEKLKFIRDTIASNSKKCNNTLAEIKASTIKIMELDAETEELRKSTAVLEWSLKKTITEKEKKRSK